MLSSRVGMRGRLSGRRWGLVQASLALVSLMAVTGCQVEYAGMTLPSGKYFLDDVHYFPSGPEFPYANTQAATQRARMQAMGIPTPPVPGTPSALEGSGLNASGVPVLPTIAPGVTPRPGAASEMENSMPGGSSAPAVPPSAPAPAPNAAPGAAAVPPPG